MKNAFLFVLELVKIVVFSLVIIIPVRYFLIQPFYVKGDSMKPNFHNNEYLIVDEINYRFNDPKRGDIVVFRYPKNPQEFFIKRIIALPGEKVSIKNGDIKIYNDEHPDGFVLDETYLDPNLETYSADDAIVELRNDDTSTEYFVLGDNRGASKDSRIFGPVNKSFIIGRVLFRGWPFDKIDVFKAPEYIYN